MAIDDKENQKFCYYTHDITKNVCELLDGAEIIATYDYTPFGDVATNFVNNNLVNNHFAFSSEYHDDELGLIYYNYRHYNPTDGHWLSRDPIAEQGGMNLYNFVQNNAMNVIDILGNNNSNQIKKENNNIADKWIEYVATESGFIIVEIIEKDIQEYINKLKKISPQTIIKNIKEIVSSKKNLKTVDFKKEIGVKIKNRSIGEKIRLPFSATIKQSIELYNYYEYLRNHDKIFYPLANAVHEYKLIQDYRRCTKICTEGHRYIDNTPGIFSSIIGKCFLERCITCCQKNHEIN